MSKVLHFRLKEANIYLGVKTDEWEGDYVTRSITFPQVDGSRIVLTPSCDCCGCCSSLGSYIIVEVKND